MSGALRSVHPGAFPLECGTVTVKWIRGLAVAAWARGCALPDDALAWNRFAGTEPSLLPLP